MTLVLKSRPSLLFTAATALALCWAPWLHAQAAPTAPVNPQDGGSAGAYVTAASDMPASSTATIPSVTRPTRTAAPLFSISGFGTLGVTHSSLGSADYTSTAFEPNGAGRSRRYDLENDSVVGVQLTAHVTDKLSAILQIVSQHSYDNSYTPHVEWANIKYAFTPDFSVRVGRIDLPTFANSDYRNVGYANPWLRVPVEVYNNNPITHSDGADASYRFRVGPVVDTVRIMYGLSTFHVTPGPIRAKATDLLGLFDTIEYGAFTGHIGYVHGNVNLAGFPPSYNFLSSTSYSISAAYDPGKWFVQAELARVTSEDTTPGYINGYITAGYRIGTFTPYLTYAQSHSLGHPTITGNSNFGQRDASVGIRWDFAKNFDLKAQYDHVWLPSDSTGSLTNFQSDYRLGSGTNVFSLALDFVF